MTILILSVAALGLISIGVSITTQLTLPWMDRLASTLPERHRVRLWLVVASLPWVLGGAAVLVSFLPAIGFGHDHCLAHGPHHPHLCPHHAVGTAGGLLMGIAALVAVRLIYVVVRIIRTVQLSTEASRALAQASDRDGDLLVFFADTPRAFVLGVFHPRIHVSTALLALGPSVVEPVLAHERVHALRRDMSWRVLCPLLAFLHLPHVASAIFSRLALAQEMAADVEGAEQLPDGRLRIAEALIALAKIPRSPTHALSFTHGDLQQRVSSLLRDPNRSTWRTRLLLGSSMLMLIATVVAHHRIHHSLETLLGVLSW